ncbi:MAG TPA: SPFH domain-containing protein [Gemmatimonadales bacterium]|nr:SPFH domain-containing protein [Gemmatimonadales bacterium]HRX19331.1 SPFH domain-containing protein [Gemmatimonadales bacterium]
MIREIERKATNGVLALLLLMVLTVFTVLVFVSGARDEDAGRVLFGVGLAVITLVSWTGLFAIQPNTAKALTLFGQYKGSVRTAGLWWVNPFMTKKAVSLRVRNFETAKLKVNDLDSNPVEIGAVVVWQVFDSAEALFEVDNYEDYVRVQSESAVRSLATQYPYDAHSPEVVSLSHNAADISEKLAHEVQDRLQKAGIKVLEARITHLAYSPEIAQAMLRRQQASAIIAAREKIVEGAVSMVDMALKHIERDKIVALDEERKAAMVSNLLVTLCTDQPMHPVINTGSLYQ